MGPVGTSLGLALKRANLTKTEVIGTSANRGALSTASKLGAVDQAIPNLGTALRGAGLVILDTPLRETREMMEAIGPMVEDGCVVTDTSASKLRVMEWSEELLPTEVNFIGGHPLTQKTLHSVEEADPSIFDGIQYCVIPGKSANREAVKTVTKMVEMLGAKPLFLDTHEHDSYAAAMNYLPIVVSAAFVTATTGSDGWREMHRLAASEFGDLSRLASDDPEDNEAACLANPDELVQWLDQVITELYSYRNQIKERSDELLDTFIKAWEGRARWKVGAVAPSEGQQLPSSTEAVASLFVGQRLTDRLKKMTGDKGDKEKRWKYRQDV